MILFGASFLAVFLLYFQQQNVTKKLYIPAFLTSIGITLSQFFVIRGVVVDTSYVSVLLMMSGGVIGVLLSMFLHDRVF